MGCVCGSFEHNLGDCVSKRSWVSKRGSPSMYLDICILFLFLFFFPVLLGYN